MAQSHGIALERFSSHLIVYNIFIFSFHRLNSTFIPNSYPWSLGFQKNNTSDIVKFIFPCSLRLSYLLFSVSTTAIYLATKKVDCMMRRRFSVCAGKPSLKKRTECRATDLYINMWGPILLWFILLFYFFFVLTEY